MIPKKKNLLTLKKYPKEARYGNWINSLMTAFPGVSVIQSLGNVDIEDVSENMAEGIDELFDEMSSIDASDVDLKVVDKFVKITDAMNLVADVVLK